MAHPLNIPAKIRETVEARLGKPHPYDRLDPAKTALIVVDMQNYFVAPGFPAAADEARNVAENINRLADVLRRAGGKVFWIVTEALPDDANDWGNLYEMLGGRGKATRLEGLERESEGYAMWPGMDVREEDETVVKTRYSAIIHGSSDLEERLRRSGVDTVLIAGVATNICCEATARDSMMLGFRTIMVHDSLAAFTDDAHNAALATFYQMFGDVQSTEETAGFLGEGR